MRTVLPFMFALLAGTALLAQTPARDRSPVTFVGTAVVTGRVVAEDEARTPLRNATVYMERANIEDIRSTTTDAEGRLLVLAAREAKRGIPGDPDYVAPPQAVDRQFVGPARP